MVFLYRTYFFSRYGKSDVQKNNVYTIIVIMPVLDVDARYDDWRDVRRTVQTDRRAIDTRETRVSARSPTHRHAVEYIIIIICYISRNRASSGFRYHRARRRIYRSYRLMIIWARNRLPGKEKNGLFFLLSFDF